MVFKCVMVIFSLLALLAVLVAGCFYDPDGDE